MDRSLALLAAGAAWASASVALAGGPFAIIALPDTQNYVNDAGDAPLFTQQTQWVADQIQVAGNPRNIVFVTHLGDVVSTGTSITQWDRADASMSVIDDVVPYGVLPGNHDYATTGVKSTGTDNYVAYFGPQRFAGQPWFGGAEPSGNNTYQLFEGGGFQFLHIALEWRPSENVTNGPVRDPSPVEWAQSVISANPGVPVIVSTHEYVDDDPPGRSGAGEALWNELVRQNDQIILVLNGHFHSAGGTNDGEYHQVSQNDFGKDVVEVLQDYQDYPNGGDGWLRIITFDPAADEIRFETYSPVLDDFQTETVDDVGPFASQFAIAMDFDARFDFEAPPQPPAPIFEDLTFTQGEDGYAGTLDKEIRSSGGDAANGDATSISVDGDDGSPGSQPNHGLVRFESIVGPGDGQIAPGDAIESAQLVLNVVNPGSGFEVYGMLADWDESTTWADLGGDGVTPGVDADAQPTTFVGANDAGENVRVGALALEIGPLAQGGVDGAANRGVGLVAFPSGTNGVDFTTSESTAPPTLRVRRLLPELGIERFRQGVGTYVGAVDTQIRQADPGGSYGSATSVSVDASDPSGNQNHVLLRFENLFGPDGVPTDREIVRAWITVQADNPGDGAAVHRMLVPWSDTATWGGDFGGDGVQADGIDAVAAVEDVVSGATGPVEIDVTAAVSAWQAAPAENFGVVLLPLGNNGWDFATSEAATNARPELTVVFADTVPCPGDVTGDGAVDIADLNDVLANFNGAGPIGDANGDGVVDITDLNLVLANFGVVCD